MLSFHRVAFLGDRGEECPDLFWRLRKPLRLIFCYVVFVFGAFVPPSVAQSQAHDESEANPGRPTVSTPATLTPVGYLQFETGFTAANDSPEFSSRYSLGEAIKLSVAPRLEFLVVGEPVAHF